ncbi:methyltransferase domain-containing protein [candidate division KSB1 bacterium]|nr:methyltransferase domain-containing protein [candidate division KSB1 bacterium]RQW06050.1 MAG: methyltransferase domain-containing protein [candidate division KSB1 bacterium]
MRTSVRSGERKKMTSTTLSHAEFPRANQYDPAWVLENQMGPNALQLMEWLTKDLPLESGMRVLDLGCGRAMSSIFLAREYGVTVWASDLWITPDHNWQRARQAGVEALVFPLRAEAHSLPFAQGFFDAIVSVDAYHYWGTDELYLGYLSRFLCPGGMVGIAVPGLMQEIDQVPEHLAAPQASGKVFWEDECWSFKTAAWWRQLWSRCGKVANVRADTLADGWRYWRDFEKALEEAGKRIFPSDWQALEADHGRYIGFVRAIAERTDKEAINLYDASVGVQAGVDE